MQKDLLPDFLHLFHAFENEAAALDRLLAHFDNDPGQARRATAADLRALGFTAKAIANLGSNHRGGVERDLDWAAKSGHRLISYLDPAYPAQLRQIADFPPLLYTCGDPGLLALPQIAIVGSRLCTPGGASTAFDFAASLAAAGYAITSGLALGIDAEAHRGALHAGGATIAVIATGADLDYPATNRQLAARVRETGLVVSEFALGSPARRHHFPRRNRIISGLAQAVLVVEAARRSGSLITAGLAADQGREVLAIPGSIHNPQARGCHDLIRDGAILVETPADVIETLAPGSEYRPGSGVAAPATRATRLDAHHQKLLGAIGYDPVHSDVLAQRTGLTIDQLSSMLLVLELGKLIQSAPGGCFVRI